MTSAIIAALVLGQACERMAIVVGWPFAFDLRTAYVSCPGPLVGAECVAVDMTDTCGLGPWKWRAWYVGPLTKDNQPPKDASWP